MADSKERALEELTEYYEKKLLERQGQLEQVFVLFFNAVYPVSICLHSVKITLSGAAQRPLASCPVVRRPSIAKMAARANPASYTHARSETYILYACVPLPKQTISFSNIENEVKLMLIHL